MRSIDRCPICSSKKIISYQARMAGFIAERVFAGRPQPVRFCRCRSCGFYFYNPRYEEDDLKRLYADYRGNEYQRVRERFEPYYTKELNASLGSGPEEIRLRKELLRDFLSREVDLKNIKTVLDYGGDRGQFIIDELVHADRYVYDISGVATEPGIISLRSKAACKGRHYDLIMCCHVLEHVPEPLKELEGIIDMADAGTLFYVELPYDLMVRKDQPGLKQMALRISMRSPFVVDMLSRQGKLNFQLHEHINFFEIDSLRKLMEMARLEVIKVEIPSEQIGPTKSSFLRCLARKV